jgi:hypothetical protein
MNKTIRLALAGAAILALSAPALARSHAKADRMSVRHTAVQQSTAAAATRRGAPVRSGTDWDAQIGFDRASSPFGHDGY